jgi:DNA-binding response OmpR family regulator
MPQEYNGGMSQSLLLVEDDSTIAHMYSQKFEQAGFDVLHADDAQTALTALVDKKFDILLIDILLPKINGLQLIKEIRKDHRQDKTPIVIVTQRRS